jgi:hypothetical protein
MIQILALPQAVRGMMSGSGHGVNAGVGLVDGVDDTELSTQQEPGNRCSAGRGCRRQTTMPQGDGNWFTIVVDSKAGSTDADEAI